MRLAIIHWYTRAVGGIATRVNTYRNAAIRSGDTCDILISKNITTGPKLFSERQWVYGGDTRIWIDGNAPHGARVTETVDFINQNYDAVAFSFICPHPCPTYKEPLFLPLYEGIALPKMAFISDWYWDKYGEWAKLCLPHVNGVAVPIQSYANMIPDDVKNVKIVPFPFIPVPGTPLKRSKNPLVVWASQWRSFKGPEHFLNSVPKLMSKAEIEIYSSGIRYYQLRTKDCWIDAVGEDRFTAKYSGTGRATYFGNVSLEEIAGVYQRAWFSVCLQGMNSGNKALKQGSFNNAEVEAMYYGACPVLHESALNTTLPEDCFVPVASPDDVAREINKAIKSGFATDPERQRRARSYIRREHWAINRYQDIKQLLGVTT